MTNQAKAKARLLRRLYILICVLIVVPGFGLSVYISLELISNDKEMIDRIIIAFGLVSPWLIHAAIFYMMTPERPEQSNNVSGY